MVSIEYTVLIEYAE